jgi:hypothetical protein
MNGVRIFFEVMVRIAQPVPGLAIIGIYAQSILVGLDCVIVVFEIRVGRSEFMPGIGIAGMVTDGFPVCIDCLGILLEMTGSNPTLNQAAAFDGSRLASCCESFNSLRQSAFFSSASV